MKSNSILFSKEAQDYFKAEIKQSSQDKVQYGELPEITEARDLLMKKLDDVNNIKGE